MSSTEFEGSCLCARVKLKVVGLPKTAGICHCESCRRWHAAPVNAWALWRNENVTVTQGENFLQGYAETAVPDFLIAKRRGIPWFTQCCYQNLGTFMTRCVTFTVKKVSFRLRMVYRTMSICLRIGAARESLSPSSRAISRLWIRLRRDSEI